MYGHYPPPPYYPPPQSSGVVYVPYPMKGNGKGRKGSRDPVTRDPLAFIAKAKDDLDRLEKMFKKEEKKDDKKGRTFTLLETIALQFIFMLPTTLILYLFLKLIAKAGGI